METQIHTCYLTKKGPSLVTLFGYSTKSVPGLEINGVGKYGKFIKEKIVFITRSRGLQIPLKRFVLNVEITDDLGDLESSSVKWLEYPLLLHYWFLAGLIPISKLDNCFAIGSITPSGVIEEPSSKVFVDLCEGQNFHLISSNDDIHGPNGFIDARELLGQITNLEFKVTSKIA
jgi:hypothetical protein